MNNFKEYDITTLFPGSMRACSMRDAGALWSYSEFDESMGMYFSLLNGCWLLDSSIYGDDRDDLFLIPACITYKDEPEQYVVVSETTLRQTLSLLNSGQSCVWDSSELISVVNLRSYTGLCSISIKATLQSCLLLFSESFSSLRIPAAAGCSFWGLPHSPGLLCYTFPDPFCFR